MSLDFSDFMFFEEVCDQGFKETQKKYHLSNERALNSIEKLEKFFGFSLFIDNKNPSKFNLTDQGYIFLCHARNLVQDFSKNFNKKYMLTNKRLTIKSEPLLGKHIVIPAVQELNQNKIESSICISTTDEVSVNSEFDALFCEISANDHLIFDYRWKIELEQWLYVGKQYEIENNKIRCVQDLANHSILALGTSFIQELNAKDNWHLSLNEIQGKIEPSMIIKSRSVLNAAIRANLGIGPIVELNKSFAKNTLNRILPELKGPNLCISFAIKRGLNREQANHVFSLENLLISKIKSMEIFIIS